MEKLIRSTAKCDGMQLRHSSRESLKASDFRMDFCFHPRHVLVDLEPDVVEPSNADKVNVVVFTN